ncbi:MAG: hypothetical protein OXE99_12770 [Cellvibrionales bacterium]|nr:hypothetical protein [Cellvibrionales bacterium]
MGEFTKFISSITPFTMSLYFFSLLLLEFLFSYFLNKNKKRLKSLLFNTWEFFGLAVPIFWLLQLERNNNLSLLSILVASLMGCYYGLLKPVLYSRNKKITNEY